MSANPFDALGIGGAGPVGRSGDAADPFADLPMPDAVDRRPAAALRAGDAPGAAAADEQEEGDVLVALHREFDRVLVDPSRLEGRHGRPAGSEQREAPWAFEDLCTEAVRQGHVLDMLVPREPLDRFIARFLADLDPADAHLLLNESRPDEVLQLFAPPVAASRKRALPETTRRDHHALSPDSAIDIGRFLSAPTRDVS